MTKPFSRGMLKVLAICSCLLRKYTLLIRSQSSGGSGWDWVGITSSGIKHIKKNTCSATQSNARMRDQQRIPAAGRSSSSKELKMVTGACCLCTSWKTREDVHRFNVQSAGSKYEFHIRIWHICPGLCQSLRVQRTSLMSKYAQYRYIETNVALKYRPIVVFAVLLVWVFVIFPAIP